ncbi:MAG: hypothetical protein R8L07_11070 [Alphaproteobacteria bacterium]|nr:hypothetical protein [Alphaproteobacteria bacterium]
MNLDAIVDFAKAAHAEIGRYNVTVTLTPSNILAGEYAIAALTWTSIKYGPEEIEKVPDDKRGIYAFAVHHPSGVLPPHGYVLYIGIAGRDSDRSLRDRYRDYLNVKKVVKRPRIARMIGDWHEVLKFFFAPIEGNVSSEDLKKIEQQLNTALMPPFSVGDLEAGTKAKRRAFQ